jgi:hypothetical protein
VPCVRPFTKGVCRCFQCRDRPCTHPLCEEQRRASASALLVDNTALSVPEVSCCCRTFYNKFASTWVGQANTADGQYNTRDGTTSVCFQCREAINAPHGSHCCWWVFPDMPEGVAYRTENMPLHITGGVSYGTGTAATGPAPAATGPAPAATGPAPAATGPAPPAPAQAALPLNKTLLPSDASSVNKYACRKCGSTVKKRPREYEGGTEPHDWWWCADCRKNTKKPSAAEIRNVKAARGSTSIRSFLKK